MDVYNTGLSFYYLTENSDGCFLFDNDLGCRQKRYSSFTNHFIGQTISGITSALRFPSELNFNLRSLMTNLVPFQKLHFFATSCNPMNDYGSGTVKGKINFSGTKDVIKEMFDASNMMCRVDPR